MTAHFCTTCGAPLPSDAHFCTACGTHLDGADDAAASSSGPADGGPPAPPPPVPPPPAAPPVTTAAAPAPLPSGGRTRSVVIIAVLAVLLVVVGAVAVVALTRDDGHDEVVLEPTGVEVPDPFTASTAVDEKPLGAVFASTTTSGAASTTASTTTSAPPGLAGGAVTGSAPGLYGGTRDVGSCDPERMISFLQSDRAKAKAWAGVQHIEASEIPTFVRSLTPVVLRRDTRVLNHGYRNGKATPRAAVLQAGTAVLVDDFGIPRAKCGCGNPLAEPKPVTTKTRYTGTRWAGFKPANVVVVRQDVKVQVFVVVDVTTGRAFERPVGSTGAADTAASSTTPGGASTTTTAPRTSTSTEATTTTLGTGTSEGTAAPILFQIASIAGVSNGPTAPSVAELPAARITAISTYHWNDATGATPGTISLKAADGTVYGPFQATGSDGQGGVPNANWTAITNVEIPAGTYTVVDSSPETWAWAGDTGGRGMVTIWGIAD